MRKFVTLLFAAALALCTAASAQQTPPTNQGCDSTSNLSTDGTNTVCTQILFAAGYPTVNAQENVFLPIVQEDNYVPSPTNPFVWPGLYGEFNPAFFSTNIISGGAGIPEDPLKILGYILCGGINGPVSCTTYGYIASDLTGSMTSDNPVLGPVDTTCRNYRGQYSFLYETVTYHVSGWTEGNPVNYNNYFWNGTITVKYTERKKVGRYGCYGYYYSDGQSWGTLFATQQ